LVKGEIEKITKKEKEKKTQNINSVLWVFQ
jgi:hypothetical protein